MEAIKQAVAEVFEEIVAIRRHLHENPELGFCEFKTADLVCQHLDKLGIPYQKGIATTGVVGLLEVDPKKMCKIWRTSPQS